MCARGPSRPRRATASIATQKDIGRTGLMASRKGNAQAPVGCGVGSGAAPSGPGPSSTAAGGTELSSTWGPGAKPAGEHNAKIEHVEYTTQRFIVGLLMPAHVRHGR